MIATLIVKGDPCTAVARAKDLGFEVLERTLEFRPLRFETTMHVGIPLGGSTKLYGWMAEGECAPFPHGTLLWFRFEEEETP